MIDQDQLRQSITQKIVDSLKNGKIPWKTPWRKDKNSGLPRNIASNKNYNGVNILLLAITGMASGYTSRWWGTYKQWQSIGSQVQYKQKGTQVIYWQVRYRVGTQFFSEPPANVDPETVKKVFLLRSYTVFNAQQVAGESSVQYQPEALDNLPEVDIDYDVAETVIKATKAKIHHRGEVAVYRKPIGGEFPNHTGGDYIDLPSKRRFSNPADYYGTACHELAHWTGPRLKRDDRDYAYEELVAEIGGIFVTTSINIKNDNLTNHIAYLQSWLERMQNDSKWIFHAAAQASKAADYILSFSHENGVNEDVEPDKHAEIVEVDN